MSVALPQRPSSPEAERLMRCSDCEHQYALEYTSFCCGMMLGQRGRPCLRHWMQHIQTGAPGCPLDEDRNASR